MNEAPQESAKTLCIPVSRQLLATTPHQEDSMATGRYGALQSVLCSKIDQVFC